MSAGSNDSKSGFFIPALCVFVLVASIAYVLRPQLGKKTTFGLVRKQGVVINEALERYKANHHAYPENLKALVPDYLPSISKPKVSGNDFVRQLLSTAKWQYELSSDKSTYRLQIINSAPFGYNSAADDWTFHPPPP